jgi:hypothetical protein
LAVDLLQAGVLREYIPLQLGLVHCSQEENGSMTTRSRKWGWVG